MPAHDDEPRRPDPRREVRNNLIFLVALLLLSAPGLTILVGKALRGEGGLRSDPPSVRVATPYLNPVGTAPGVTRSVPPQTLAWVDSVSREVLGKPALRREAAGGRPDPVIGDERAAELLSLDPPAVLVWQHEEGPAAGSVAVVIDGEATAAESIVTFPVPPEVRHELQQFGYPNPPRSAVVAVLPARAGGLEAWELRWTRDGTEYRDVLALPGQ